ncbi:MAG: N-acetylneuraminic acid mutarotase, partial [Myxococcota bacterium]
RNKALEGSTIVDAAEAYDMTNDTWYALEDMPTKRNSAFAATVGQHIVVAGGFSGSTALDVIEIYDTVNDTWETCTETMSSAFSGGAAATLNGKLYLFGGGNDETLVEVGTFPTN